MPRSPYIRPLKPIGRDEWGRVVKCSVRACGFEIGTIRWLILDDSDGQRVEGWALFLADDLMYDWERGVWHVGRRYRRFGETDRRGAPEPVTRWVNEVAMRRPGPMPPQDFIRSLMPYWRELARRRTNRPIVRLPATVFCPAGHQTILDADTLGLDIWHDADGWLHYRCPSVSTQLKMLPNGS